MARHDGSRRAEEPSAWPRCPMPTLRRSTAASRRRATDNRSPSTGKSASPRLTVKRLACPYLLTTSMSTMARPHGSGTGNEMGGTNSSSPLVAGDQHIVCYHPDRLMRQPFDLEELLSISDEYGITLYGRVNARDLQDPDDRYALRIEIAHACRSSDDTSRRMKDQKQERAENGLHNGQRPYGYSKNGMKLVPSEAEIVREIFTRFTNGEKIYSIAVDLNRRGVPTAKGTAWTGATIRRQLTNRHVTGISVHRGQEIGLGGWPAIIPRGEWDFAQELLTFRSSAAQKEKETRVRRNYILRGLVVCGNCGTTMTDPAKTATDAHAPTAKTRRGARGP